MRIVFSARPAFGHVFPLMPLAEAAREAGHDVIFATGQAFISRLTRWGFKARQVGEGLDWAFERAAAKYPEFLSPERPEFGAAMFVDVLGQRSLADMAALIEEVRPHLVVYEATDVGAAVAAAHAGVPLVCHAISMWIAVFRDALLARIPSLWEAAGVAPTIDVTVGDIFCDIWPDSMQPAEARSEPKRHCLLRPVPWSDPETDIPGWIETSNGPLVFVSLGTVFWGKELVRKLIDVLADLDVYALVLAGTDATPDDLPTSTRRVRVTGFVDQPRVLRHADVVIHHGGAGTLLGSLANGLPQLVLPEGADRPHTAASLERSGAGISLAPRSALPEDIARAVTTLLTDPSYRERAVELRNEIRQMPSPAEVMSELEALAG